MVLGDDGPSETETTGDDGLIAFLGVTAGETTPVVTPPSGDCRVFPGWESELAVEARDGALTTITFVCD